MAIKKEAPKATVAKKQHSQVVDHTPLFGNTNYLLMAAGVAVIAFGMILMAGGKSNNPQLFNYKEIYSQSRITLAPIVIVIGLVLEIVAIFYKGKSTNIGADAS